MAKFIHTLVEHVPSVLRPVLLAAFLFFLAVLLPQEARRLFRAVRNFFSSLANHKALAIFVLFFLVVGIRLTILPLLPVPTPSIHDEFSYLLMADTFAHGRLTNPTHPMWISFETFHVNWFPTYSSKYPPGQGAALALGEVLGNPWIGVLLSNAAMCAAILWMMQGWLPARWALLGGILVAMKFSIASYWMNSYWGGAVAAAGGALVLGAIPRVIRWGRFRHALLLGLGIAILANTRPFEGLFFCIPAGCWFLWWLAGQTKSRVPPRDRFVNVFLPVSAVLLATFVFIGYYNWRLTGNAFLLPHTLNSRTYRTMGLFLWDHPKPPLTYRNQQFEDFYNGWEREDYQNTWAGAWNVSKEKLVRGGATYFWWGALLLLPGVPFVFRSRKLRLPVLLFFLGVAGFFILIWSMPHYASPITCVIFLLLVQSMRYLRIVRIVRRPIGLALSWAAVLLLALEVGSSVWHHVCDPLEWTCEGDVSRAAIQEKLSHTPGKHLILVRYNADHNIHDEWVYNGAEIDSAKVLWARDIGPEQNAKLFSYFKDRQIWIVNPDEDNTELIPYEPPDGSPSQP